MKRTLLNGILCGLVLAGCTKPPLPGYPPAVWSKDPVELQKQLDDLEKSFIEIPIEKPSRTSNGLFAAYNVAVGAIDTSGRLVTGLNQVVRLLPGFQVDTSFNVTGAGPAVANLRDVAIHSNETIWAVGRTTATAPSKARVFRVNSNGTLESGFGTAGSVTVPLSRPFLPQDLTLQTDSSLFLTGYSHTGSNLDAYIVKLTSSGGFDTAFNTTGIFSYGAPLANELAFHSTLDSQGRLFFLGYSILGTSRAQAIIGRLNTNGTLDTLFQTTGLWSRTFGTSGNSFANSIAIDTSDRLVVAGSYLFSSGRFATWVTRQFSDGSLDASFETDGILTLTSYSGPTIALPVPNVVMEGNKVVVGNNVSLFRYNSDGSMDTSFAAGNSEAQSALNGRFLLYNPDRHSYITNNGFSLGAASEYAQHLLFIEQGTAHSGGYNLDDFGFVFATNGRKMDFFVSDVGFLAGLATTTITGYAGMAAPVIFSGGTYPGTAGNCTGDINNTGCQLDVQISTSASGVINSFVGISYTDMYGVARTARRYFKATASPLSTTLPTIAFGTVNKCVEKTATLTVNNASGVAVTLSTSINDMYYYPGGYPGTGGDCPSPISGNSSCTLTLAISTATGFSNAGGDLEEVITFDGGGFYGFQITAVGKIQDDDDDSDGVTECQGDCDDSAIGVNPSASENCANAIDDNCDGLIDAADVPHCVDGDADGYTTATGDCDDGNAAINPGVSETCGNGVDEDCDGSTIVGCSDLDSDGYFSTGVSPDCDDSNAAVYPGATEICGNGLDDDCSGAQNNGCTDTDGDGYFSTGTNSDCDDAVAAVNPGATETCGDGVDQDCTGGNNNGCTDGDGDGYYTTGTNTDCDDGVSGVNPGASEVCGDGVDQDCTGGNNNGCTDADSDGYYSTGSSPDCDDATAGINPGASEVCGDGTDQDCTGGNNNGCTDNDLDGYYTTGSSSDCNDSLPGINPGATETCGDGVDQDCDSNNNNGCTDADSDGYYSTGASPDCNDGAAGINPGASEVCGDGTDQDCDTNNNNGCTDADADGYYSTGTNSDCNDGAVGINPGAAEICGDGTDQDCDTNNNNGCTDADSDGYYSTGASPDCNDGVSGINPGASEVCGNGTDENCSGGTNEGCTDGDSDGYFTTGDNPDCNDADAGVYPGNGC